MMGRGTGQPHFTVAVDSGADIDFCFFFGCGSSGWLDRCFDRTGTVFVVRVATRGVSGYGKRGPEAGGGLDSETGLRSAGAMAL